MGYLLKFYASCEVLMTPDLAQKTLQKIMNTFVLTVFVLVKQFTSGNYDHFYLVQS